MVVIFYLVMMYYRKDEIFKYKLLVIILDEINYFVFIVCVFLDVIVFRIKELDI